jgi:hypothetical protein
MDAAMKMWERFIQQTADALGSCDGIRASRAATQQNRAFTYKVLTDHSLSFSEPWPGAEGFGPWPARRAILVVARSQLGQAAAIIALSLLTVSFSLVPSLSSFLQQPVELGADLKKCAMLNKD